MTSTFATEAFEVRLERPDGVLVVSLYIQFEEQDDGSWANAKDILIDASGLPGGLQVVVFDHLGKKRLDLPEGVVPGLFIQGDQRLFQAGAFRTAPLPEVSTEKAEEPPWLPKPQTDLGTLEDLL